VKLSVKQAAKEAGVSPSAVRRWIKTHSPRILQVRATEIKFMKGTP
jgi:predicted transcriptional regulator